MISSQKLDDIHPTNPEKEQKQSEDQPMQAKEALKSLSSPHLSEEDLFHLNNDCQQKSNDESEQQNQNKELESPQSKQKSQQGQDFLGLSTSQGKSQGRQGFKYTKNIQERFSVSEKIGAVDSGLLYSSSPLCYSDQQQFTRKSTTFNQHSKPSHSQNSTNNNGSSELGRCLSTLKKNLFVNSTSSFLPSSFLQAKEGILNDENQILTSPLNGYPYNESYQFQQICDISTAAHPFSSSQQQQDCYNDNVANKSFIKNMFDQFQNQSSLLSLQSSSDNNLNNHNEKITQVKGSSQFLSSQEEVGYNLNQKTPISKPISQSEFGEEESEKVKNSSPNQTNSTNLNLDILPYISFLQPNSVLPGLGASNDNLYIALTLLSQGIAQVQQQTALFNSDNQKEFNLPTQSELKELNQIDFSKINDSIISKNIQSLILNSIALNTEQIRQDQFQRNDSHIHIENIEKINQEKEESFSQSGNNELSQKCTSKDKETLMNQQQIEGQEFNFQKEKQHHKLDLQNWQCLKSNSINKDQKGQQNKGFQLSASHLNSKKGFQMTEGIKIQLNAGKIDIKDQQKDCNQSIKIDGKQKMLISLQQNQNYETKQNKMFEHNQEMSKKADWYQNQNDQNLHKSEKHYVYPTLEKVVFEKSLEKQQENKRIRMCKYKQIQKESKIRILINQSNSSRQKLKQAKYKYKLPSEQSQFQVINLSTTCQQDEESSKQLENQFKLDKNNEYKQIKFQTSDKIEEVNQNIENNLALLNQTCEINQGNIQTNINTNNFQNNSQHYLKQQNDVLSQNKSQQSEENLTFERQQQKSKTSFRNQSQEISKFILQQQSSPQLNQSPSPTKMIIKMKRVQNMCKLLSSEEKQVEMFPSNSILNVLKQQNHYASNISLIPEKSSCHSNLFSSQFMEIIQTNNKNNENDSEPELRSFLFDENYENQQEKQISNKYLNIDQEKRDKVPNNSINFNRSLISGKKKQPFASTNASLFKHKKFQQKNPCMMNQQDRISLGLDDNAKFKSGRKRKNLKIHLPTLYNSNEKEKEEELEDNSSNNLINKKIEKKRNKVKKSKLIYGGPAPSPKYTQLAEIIMPDKYEQYLNQVGAISRSNTISSQTTQPIYHPILFQENSALSASSLNESNTQKKVEQKNNEKETLFLSESNEIEMEEQNNSRKIKTKRQAIKQNDKEMEEESSGSDLQDKNNLRNNEGTNTIKNKFDTKNLVKNFLNQFLSFVLSEEEEKQVMQLLNITVQSDLAEYKNMLKLFFKNKKFNRALLKEFIFVVDFRKLFDYFLTNRAHDWISQGRMKDKASHFRALQNFIYICQNHDEIKSWRFRYNFV